MLQLETFAFFAPPRLELLPLLPSCCWLFDTSLKAARLRFFLLLFDFLRLSLLLFELLEPVSSNEPVFVSWYIILPFIVVLLFFFLAPERERVTIDAMMYIIINQRLVNLVFKKRDVRICNTKYKKYSTFFY